MNEYEERVAREQASALLRGGNAHMTFDQAVADFPLDRINEHPPNVEYTIWHLVEHLRITQWDILNFVIDPDHISPKWPEGYWPAQDAIATEADWNATLQRFREDLGSLQDLAADCGRSLTDDLPHAPGYTLLRELLLAADHNAYHIGELGILRQVMGTW
ncbi:MAG: DinB family protein [Anaerolineales bacterium]